MSSAKPTNEDSKNLQDPLVGKGKSKIPLLLKSGWSFLFEVGKVVLISLLIITVVKNYLFQPFYVKGASMEPTFFDKEYLIINEIAYRFREPERGDVVVLRYPRDPSQFFIKRVVGLPGEDVEVREGSVFITNNEHPQGFRLDESWYLDPSIETNGGSVYHLGLTQYYVLGDNRPASLDSRSASLGPVDRSAIVGRAWFRLWPVTRFTIFASPNYGAPASEET